MKKEELKNLFVKKGILSKDGSRRKQCWLKFFDDESKKLFNDFSKQYRSDDEAWFCLLHNVEPYSCEVCGNLAKFTGRKKSKIPGYLTVCDNCSANASKQKLKQFKTTISSRTDDDKKHITEKRKHTNLVKYGDENYTLYGSAKFKNDLQAKYGSSTYNNREKAKQTCIERYGVPCNLSVNSSNRAKHVWKDQRDIIIEKIKETSIKKYGCTSPNQSENVKKNQQISLIENYGSLNNAYTHKREVAKNTKLERYGDEYYHNKEQGIKTLNDRHTLFEQEHNCTRYTHLVKRYGQGWIALNLPIIRNGRFRYISNDYLPNIEQYVSTYHNMHSSSNEENELYDFISSCTNCKILKNKKSIISDSNGYYELDIYIPELNLAFEFNGSYWHSSLYKDKFYHQNKTKLCYEKGIQLIHVYEYDWVKNKELIKNHIQMLFDGKDCSEFNWISPQKYNLYKLSEPEEIKIPCNNNIITIYNEGKFILK